ncbi:hypothetical protein HETIRDRAFT_449006 [Heterobasidion irregulare TC 32-1]|uniref:Uncharacterized protein n=1 Tax=Heterobasidion irregulare (strain TC 32-1) TaxID=747525 RepID=W4KM14_HETIT|nr:uncharacterized protein HETIRDRAFT_449006 [Heterobasidion irregulare TC 32-1]ETW86101.1 hypothetical protein HETIRDRAFT_449006 [Heterobasidion irregulare TC 32-1]
MSLPTILLRRTTANGSHMGSPKSLKTLVDWHRALEDIQPHLTPHRLLCLALLASALALALVLGLGLLRQRPAHPPKAQPRLPDSRALAALQRLLVPTRSRWPEPYTALAARADADASHTLYLPLAILLRDLLAGAVELRHPARSLHALLAGAEPGAGGGGSGDSDGWRVRVVVDVGLRCTVLAQLARERLFPAPFDVSRRSPFPACPSASPSAPLSDGACVYARLRGCMRAVRPVLTGGAFSRRRGAGAHLCFSLAAREGDLPPSPGNDNDEPRPPSPPPRASFALDLDAVPPPELESLLHHLHAALPTAARAPLKLTLHLTTLGAHLSPLALALDPSFILAAVPFLPPPPPKPAPATRREPARTSLALTASLPHVLSHLHQAHFALLSATHVSDARAFALRRAHAADRAPLDARARMLAAWEAALLERGILRRWEIVVRKEG